MTFLTPCLKPGIIPGFMVCTNACFPSLIPTSSRLHFFFSSSFYLFLQHFIFFYCLIFRTFPFTLQFTAYHILMNNFPLHRSHLWFTSDAVLGNRVKEWGIGIWFWPILVLKPLFLKDSFNILTILGRYIPKLSKSVESICRLPICYVFYLNSECQYRKT